MSYGRSVIIILILKKKKRSNSQKRRWRQNYCEDNSWSINPVWPQFWRHALLRQVAENLGHLPVHSGMLRSNWRSKWAGVGSPQPEITLLQVFFANPFCLPIWAPWSLLLSSHWGHNYHHLLRTYHVSRTLWSDLYVLILSLQQAQQECIRFISQMQKLRLNVLPRIP